MIIKITINDNDFAAALEGFCRKISGGYPLPALVENASGDAITDYILAVKRWNEIYGMTNNPSQEEKEWFCQIITQAWGFYVKDHINAECLIKAFECSFVDSMTGE